VFSPSVSSGFRVKFPVRRGCSIPFSVKRIKSVGFIPIRLTSKVAGDELKNGDDRNSVGPGIIETCGPGAVKRITTGEDVLARPFAYPNSNWCQQDTTFVRWMCHDKE
jgi:hypothetical protein